MDPDDPFAAPVEPLAAPLSEEQLEEIAEQKRVVLARALAIVPLAASSVLFGPAGICAFGFAAIFGLIWLWSAIRRLLQLQAGEDPNLIEFE